MDLGVDGAGEEVEALGLDGGFGFGSGEVADLRDLAVLDGDVDGDRLGAMVDEGGGADEEIEPFWHRSIIAGTRHNEGRGREIPVLLVGLEEVVGKTWSRDGCRIRRDGFGFGVGTDPDRAGDRV